MDSVNLTNQKALPCRVRSTLLRRSSVTHAAPLLLAVCACVAAQSAPPERAVSRSIREWVVCDGKTDDALGTATAFAAAKDGAFVLTVDCPVFIHVGSDIARPIFVDNGTTVAFKGDGLFITDNVLVPAFVIANSSGIRFLDWRVKYAGSIPADGTTGGYYNNGVFIRQSGPFRPAYNFNDRTLTFWLAAHRGIRFYDVCSPWYGPTNTSAIFFFIGNTSDVVVSGMRLFAPHEAKGSDFIGMAFSLHFGYNSGQNVTRAIPFTSAHLSVPHNIQFKDIDLDGYYMGWQGQIQNAEFEHIRAHRYGDLEDANGGNVGGVGKWFAPPHLFYLNFDPSWAGLEIRNVRISDVIDFGARVGTARDRAGDQPLSGYANSLKIGGYDVVVDHYTSNRPDGLVDVLSCDNMTISNVDATYDSSFLNNLFPGIRFPSGPPGYKHLTIENVTLVDKAAVSRIPPIDGNSVESNAEIILKNVRLTVNRWEGAGELSAPRFAGAGHKVEVEYAAHAEAK